MGVVTRETEATSAVSPAKLFRVFVLESDCFLPKILPQAIQSSEVIEGDGGPGSIRKITFAEGKQLDYVKHKIESVDKDNFSYSFTLVEADAAIVAVVEKITTEIKFLATADGGSTIKTTTTYFTKGVIEIGEEKLKASEERSLKMFKAVEAYLLANPDA